MSGPRGTKRLEVSRAMGGAELVGKRLGGRYDVEALLGEGGMGCVYRVRHATLGRSFALKVLRRELCADAETVARFVQEAKIAATIRHEALVDVVDFGEVGPDVDPSIGANKPPYFVMELLEGETLASRLVRNGPLDVLEAAKLFASVADALAAAHAGGVIHRDLKPDNVFLAGRPGAVPTVKVLDFGVAKILSAQKMTRVGTVFGTPYYMSPEQAAGAEIDSRSDQYGLGVVLYESLSGRVPFDDDTYMGVLTKHVFAEPEPIDKVVADPSSLGPLAPIVMRCLAKRAAERFQDAGELASALRAAAIALEASPASKRSSARRAPLAPTVRDVPVVALPPAAVRDLPQVDRARPRMWLVGLAGSLVVIAAMLGVAVLGFDLRFGAGAPEASPAASAVAVAAPTTPSTERPAERPPVPAQGDGSVSAAPASSATPSAAPARPSPTASARPAPASTGAAQPEKTAAPQPSPKHPVLEPVW